MKDKKWVPTRHNEKVCGGRMGEGVSGRDDGKKKRKKKKNLVQAGGWKEECLSFFLRAI